MTVAPLPPLSPVSSLRNATLVDGSTADLEVRGGRIAAVLPPSDAPMDIDDLDLSGYLLVPAAVDPHAHLDKALSWDLIQPPMGDLESAIASWKSYTATVSERDIQIRAERQLSTMLAAGTTAVRSHVDLLTTGDPLRGVRGVLAARRRFAPLMDIELFGLGNQDTPDEVIDAALDAGVDGVGGCPHLADDPIGELHRLLAIADRRDVPVDLHTDESLDGPVTLDHFAAAVLGWQRNVSAGHCVRLSTLPTDRRRQVIAAVRAADIGVIANPITNLYLQGWHPELVGARGITPAAELISAGVRFAAGADNVRDPFNPLGRSDALETAMLLVVAGHLTAEVAYRAVSDGAREVMRLPAAGPRVGELADLLAIRGGSLGEVVATAPADRMVIHRGRLVARTRVTTELAAPGSPIHETVSELEQPVPIRAGAKGVTVG